MTVAHRPMDARDERFVIDSWAKSFRESNHAGLIQNEDWFAIMLPQLAKVIRMPEVRVMVAYDPSDAERVADIYGWICTGVGRVARDDSAMPLVYYAFVKSAYRRRGIARGLFRAVEIDPQAPFWYACRTRITDEMDRERALARIAPHARYEPMVARH